MVLRQRGAEGMIRSLFSFTVAACAMFLGAGTCVNAWGGLPDAAVIHITAKGKDLRAEDRVPLAVQVANPGDAPLPPVPVVLTVDDEPYAEWKLPSELAPRATATWSLTWVATRGSHVILAVIDPLNDVRESDEANNSAFISIGAEMEREPSPWSAALAGIAAFLVGLVTSTLLWRYVPRRRPGARYAVRRSDRPRPGAR